MLDTTSLTKASREKSLTVGKKRLSGRNAKGQLVVAHRGGGAKRLYRTVDFSRTKYLDLEAQVESIEYDPNRSAFIAKIVYQQSGEKSYILAPAGLKVGDTVTCGEHAPVHTGNRTQLRNMPVGSQIYNIEMVSGRGGQMCRSAGSYATLLGFDGDYAIIRTPSGESRKVLSGNYASYGIVSNSDHSNITMGKAGRVRHIGRRPEVRGKAKNPVDHPHGGGEGGSPIGMKYPKTPWGALALGRRTRNKKKPGTQLILSRRKK